MELKISYNSVTRTLFVSHRAHVENILKQLRMDILKHLPGPME